MIDRDRQSVNEQAKAKVRKRMQAKIDENNYEYYPARKQIDYFDNDTPLRVAVYVRVSTDDIRQTTSYELQKKYYEDFVLKHPNWTLVKIYADEGTSGTSLAHRDAFNQMIADCRAGRIDMIVTKNVSRFARNVVLCVGIARDLAELQSPVGVFFESECIFSLNEESQMAFTFLATMAEEESRIKSRSMESSLRMRLDHGIPLTPKLLGYSHDSEGNLVVNPEEAPTVKLAFYMYLYGYSTQQIADAFLALGRKSYLGNIKWTSGSILQILRNERHCGDVLTRKTYTPNYRDHLAKKNRGQRPQSKYFDHHEAIVSRGDFIAVQRMLDNAKYGNRSILPKLRVIDGGKLKGFVIINPRWAGFGVQEYYLAAQSVRAEREDAAPQIQVKAGDFDFRGFEITRSEFLNPYRRPQVTFEEKRIRFSAECVQRFGAHNHVELLIDPINQRFALRSADEKNRNAVLLSKPSAKGFCPKSIPAAAFYGTLFNLFGWNVDYKYRIIGSLYEKDGEVVYIFDTKNSEAFLKSYVLAKEETISGGTTVLQPLAPLGKRIRAIPEAWAASFGKQFYRHELDLETLESQSKEDWKLRLEGRIFETGEKIRVTEFEELRSYIRKELSAVMSLEGPHE